MKLKFNHRTLKDCQAKPLLKQIQVGHCLLPGNLFLAPLAGYTDIAFRSICVEYGADFTYTEMVSASALERKNEKTFKLLERAENETLLGVQLFTADYRTCLEALKQIQKYKPTVIDINCGCSIPKVLKTGAGAMLLRDSFKIKEIVKALHEATSIPITIKMRAGWDASSINYLEIAAMAEKAGAALVTLHPRTMSQRFTGKANWQYIADLKKHSSLPIIGSGDLFSGYDALRMLEETGCDGVMFARGAIGNPFIFKQTKQLAVNGPPSSNFTPLEKLTVALAHLERLAVLKGEEIACREIRKHLPAYTKGMKNSKPLRVLCNKARTIAEYREHIKSYLLH